MSTTGKLSTRGYTTAVEMLRRRDVFNWNNIQILRTTRIEQRELNNENNIQNLFEIIRTTRIDFFFFTRIDFFSCTT
jgi:hypothetical protein